MKRKFFHWLPAIVWAIGLFILSAWTSPPKVGEAMPHMDKAVHWILFSGQCWFVALALRRSHKLTLPATLAFAILIASAYGAVDEFHQRFVPHRTCDIADWVADTLGAAAGAAAFYVYESKRSAKANQQSA